MPGSGWPLTTTSTGRRLVGSAGTTTLTAYSIVSITPGNSSAFGSWVQVDASTASARYILAASATVVQAAASTLDASMLQLQIGTGAAASETVIATATDALKWAGITSGGYTGATFNYVVPPLIPAGTRLTVRGSRDTATSTMSWGVIVTYALVTSLET